MRLLASSGMALAACGAARPHAFHTGSYSIARAKAPALAASGRGDMDTNIVATILHKSEDTTSTMAFLLKVHALVDVIQSYSVEVVINRSHQLNTGICHDSTFMLLQDPS